MVSVRWKAYFYAASRQEELLRIHGFEPFARTRGDTFEAYFMVE
jgi:hypothetical protein